MDVHFLGWLMQIEVLVDAHRAEAELALACHLHERPIKHAPECILPLGHPEPSAVLSVRPGGDQGRKITMLRTGQYFLLEPPGLGTAVLRVAELTLDRHHDDP